MYVRDKVLPRVAESLAPYLGKCCGNDNRTTRLLLSREAPTVNVSWLIAVRAHCAVESSRRRSHLVDDDDGERGTGSMASDQNQTARAPQGEGCRVHYRDAVEVHRLLRERVRALLRTEMLESSLLRSSSNDNDEDEGEYD